MEFTFVSDRESTPPRLEYVTVPQVEERINGELVPVELLAQVQAILAPVMGSVWPSGRPDWEGIG